MFLSITQYGAFGIAIIMTIVQYRFSNRIAGFPQSESKVESWYLKLLPVALLFIAAYLFLFGNQETESLMNWEYVCLLSMLWVVAYVDYKEHLILNEYILLGLGLRGILLAMELLMSPSDALYRFLSEVLGSIILLMFGFLLRVMSRKGIGMGDIKLFAVLPLFLGSLGAFRAVLYALVILFVQSCFLLVLRKKGRKDELPFAPAIMGGAWILVIVSNL